MEKYPENNLYKEEKIKARKRLQRRVAIESHVFWKNEDNILPLKKVYKLKVLWIDPQCLWLFTKIFFNLKIKNLVVREIENQKYLLFGHDKARTLTPNF